MKESGGEVEIGKYYDARSAVQQLTMYTCVEVRERLE